MRDDGPRVRPSTPRDVALGILAARFGDAGAPRGERRHVFDLAGFQEDAVARATAILAARRGVIVADGVGLGKTFVALALIERALRDGERVAATSPAALRSSWTRELRRVARTLDVRDTFGLHRIDGRRHAHGPALAWFSHTRLSRGTHRPGRIGPVGLVVVDEAHAFRNPRTRRYRALASLCVGARVVLLTATPVNNSPMDLYALLRLFASDDAFRDVGVPNLRQAFRAATDRVPSGDAPGNDRHAVAPPPLVPVLREVVIRRTRSFLRSHYGGIRVPAGRGGSASVLRFPRRAPPVPVRYASDALFGSDDGALALIDELTFAPFRWPEYARSGSGRQGAVGPELLRLLLLKRLESSVDALRSSVRRQLRFHRAFRSALDAGRLLAPADFGALWVTADDGDAVQLVLEDVALRPLPARLAADELRESVGRDIERLARLHTLLRRSTARRDPKLARLRTLLHDEVGDAKTLLFTEFRTTARYLWRALRNDRAVAIVDGGGACLGDRRCARRTAIARFAPRANGAREPHRRERVDTLIATDVLAEGLDLQDASRVVSYDLPWNPVRLIQRVGRVDRLGSEHAVVHSYHFLPADGLERFLRLLARLRRKLGAIARTVGRESVLGTGSTPAADFDALVDRLAAGDADALDVVEQRDARPFEIEDRLFMAYRRTLRSTPAPARSARPLDTVPVAALPAGPDEPERILVAVAVRGAVVMTVFRSATETLAYDADDAAAILLRALDASDTPRAVVAEPEDVRRAVSAACRHAARATGDAGRAAPASARSEAARAARCLLGGVASVPGDPDPAICRRVDALLEWLASGPTAGAEHAIHETLAGRGERPGRAGLDALVEQLERVRERAASATIPPRTRVANGETPDAPRAAPRSDEPADPVALGALRVVPMAPPDPPVHGPRAG